MYLTTHQLNMKSARVLSLMVSAWLQVVSVHLSAELRQSSLASLMSNSSVFNSERQARQMIQRFDSRVRVNKLHAHPALSPQLSHSNSLSSAVRGNQLVVRGPPAAASNRQLSKDSQQITAGPFFTVPIILPGPSNMISDLNPGAPSPPPGPPSPPFTATIPITAPTTSTTPVTTSNNILVSDIRCVRSSSREQLRATVSTGGRVGAPPVLVMRPQVDAATSPVCSIRQQSDSRLLAVNINNLAACGVQICRQSNGEEWLCLTIRFPVIAGIQLPEDDVIQIQCRPQDRSQTENKQLTVAASGFDELSASAFVGHQQQFECEIALFRQSPGSQLFSTLVQPDEPLILGQEVHLRSIVRAGDGWEYSKLADVTIHKVSDSDGSSVSIPLMFNSGCRNEMYQRVAPNQPARHQETQLITNFPFRVFAFQGMTSGDRIQVTARVTGCLEAIDCAPSACADGVQGVGRRRRKRRSVDDHGANVTTDWRRDMTFSVMLPDISHAARDQVIPDSTSVMSGCPAHLLGSLLAALVFTVLLFSLAVYALNVRRGRQARKAAVERSRHLQHPAMLSVPRQPPVYQWPASLVEAPCCHRSDPSGDPTKWSLNKSLIDGASCSRCSENDSLADESPSMRTRRRRIPHSARMRRSFSAGCVQRAAACSSRGHVSVVTVAAPRCDRTTHDADQQENIYSELAARCDLQPTMV